MKLKKITKFVAVVSAACMLMTAMPVMAAEEITVTEQNSVLYANDNTVLYASADVNSTVVLTDVLVGLPITVTGITSNGFYCVDIGDGNTYYVPGNGLSTPAPNAVAAVGGRTMVKVFATQDEDWYYGSSIIHVKKGDGSYVKVTAENATSTTATMILAETTGKYTCEIDVDTDYALLAKWINQAAADQTPRADYTDHIIYVNLRDELEEQIAAGATVAEAQYTCQIASGEDVVANLFIDMLKAYPQYQNVDSSIYASPEYYRRSMADDFGFTDSGDRKVTYYITLSCDPTAEARAAEREAASAQQAAEVYAKIAAAKAGATWH